MIRGPDGNNEFQEENMEVPKTRNNKEVMAEKTEVSRGKGEDF